MPYHKCIKTREVNDYWCKTEKHSEDLVDDDHANWGICNDKCEKMTGDLKCI